MNQSAPAATETHFRLLPRRPYTLAGALAVALAAALLLWLQHKEWLSEPNAYIVGGNGDGFKNMSTFVWHIKYDSSYVQYGGMNYPYGEHVLFTDNQPIFSALLQWWNWHISPIAEQAVGIHNLFLAVSMLFGGVILFLLLRKLHISVWYAGLAALGILFLSPQYNRFDGHYALSHTWVFPLLLYLLCRYEERLSRRYQSLLIGFVIWIAAQLHFYYLGLSALFLALYTFYQIIIHPTGRNIRARLSHFVVMIVLPVVLLNIWVHWANFATDRPASPYGFSTYLGYWEGVFLPYESWPLFQWIDKNLVRIRRIDFEAQEYAGMAVFLYFLWSVFIRQFKLFPKEWESQAYHRVHRNYLRGSFFASCMLLLFSCGIPFIIPGLEWIVKYFGPLRQFRGLGRFTWAFYYVSHILLFYTVWNYHLTMKGRRAYWLRWVIIGLPLLLAGYEAYTFQRLKEVKLQPNITRSETIAQMNDRWRWINQVDYSRYQALYPMPYYHIGSENIWLEPVSSLFQKVQVTALNIGRPDMGVMLSRTPVSETVRSVQLSLEPCTIPEILSELPNNKPIALMGESGSWPEVVRRYPYLLQKAKMEYEDGGIKVLTLYPDSLVSVVREHVRSVENDMQAQRLYPRAGNWFATDPGRFFYHQSFDSITGIEQLFQGNGAYAGRFSDTTWLWRAHLPKGQYYISLWLYAKVDMGLTNMVKIIEHNQSDDKQIWLYHQGARDNMRSIVNGWVLFDIPFEVRQDKSRMDIFLEKPGSDNRFYLDEVMIKDSNMTLFRRTPGWIVRNNYWYDLEVY